MWKAPNRPNHEITQPYNDGMVTIFAAKDVAKPGYAPQVELTKKVTLPYAEQRLGIQRYYQGMQNQIEIERVIRVPKSVPVNSQDVAQTEDGRKYRIDLVQNVLDVYPPSLDLTLVKVSQGVSEWPGRTR